MTGNKGLGFEAYKPLWDQGMSTVQIAKQLGVHPTTVQKSLKRHGIIPSERNIDPAIEQGMNHIGTNMVPSVAWIKTKSKGDEPGYSLMLRPGPEPPQAVAERVREALEGMEAAPVVQAPEHTESDLLTLYPITDVHLGMQAWKRETGEDYSTTIAADRLKAWIGKAIAASPASHTAIILDNGDLTHADDTQNVTPTSKHALDVDTRHFKTMDVAVEALAFTVTAALEKHQRVIVRILPGNHNRESYIVCLFALAERFRDNPRVTVQKEPGEFFCYAFGKVLIAAHHGDKAKADRMVHFLADEYAELWGRTRHRYLFTGHLHHHKSQDIGGVQWEQLRAVTARDAYAMSHAYTARAQLQGITYHRQTGEVSRVKISA
jgi:hypothetical protein